MSWLPRRCRISAAVNATTARIYTSRCILTVMSMAGWKEGMLLAEHYLLFIIIIIIYFDHRSSLLRMNID